MRLTMRALVRLWHLLSPLPFNAVGPVSRRHFSLLDICFVTCLERRLTFSGFLVTRHTLLPEPDRLNLVAFFGDDNVGLGWVTGCALGFVVACYACTL